MSTTETLAFPIPNAVLEPYIRQAVSSAISSALGDGTKVIEQAVMAALGEQVDSSGKVSSYRSENKYPLVEILARNKIRDLAKEVVGEMAEAMRPQVKASIEKQLKSKHSELAQALVDGAIESLKTSWSVSVSFKSDK